VDTDAKKMERFRDGLDGDLYERLILLEPNSYHELVNKAISQEDAMKKAQEDRKRQADFTSGSESSKQFRFVKKRTHGSSQSSPSGQWRRTPLQDKPSGNLQYQKNPQHVPKLKELPSRICYNCRQPGHLANECPNPRQQKLQQQKQNPGSTKGNRNKKPSFQVKQIQLNFISNPLYSGTLPTLSFTFESRDEILFMGSRL
jgi:hypothetical protein